MRATRGVIGRSPHARQYKKNSVVITESSLLRLLDLLLDRRRRDGARDGGAHRRGGGEGDGDPDGATFLRLPPPSLVSLPAVVAKRLTQLAKSTSAASKEATGGACWRAGSGWVSSQVGWPQPVRWPATSRLSLTAKVRPARGPSGSVGAARASQWSTKHPPLPVRGTSGRTSTTLGASPSDPRSVVLERRRG